MDDYKPADGEEILGDGQSKAANFRARVVSALGATVVIQVLDRLAQIGLLAVLARLLTPPEVGIAAAATVFVSLLTMLSLLGIGPALIQLPRLDQRTLAAGRTIMGCSAVIFFIGMELAAPLAGIWFKNPAVVGAVRALAILSVLQAIVIPASAVLARNLRAKDIAWVEAIGGIIGNGVVAVPLALLGWSYWALIIGYVATAAVKAVLLTVIARLPRLSRFGMSQAKRLWVLGPGFLLTTLLQRLLAESDRLIIGRYLPAGDLGLYSRANGLMAMPSNFFGSVLDHVGFPAFAQIQTEPARLRMAYMQAMSLTALIGLPLTVFMVGMGADIIRVILGPTWVGAIAPFEILCLAAYFRLSDRMSAVVLRASGKPYRMAALQILLGLTSVVGVLVAWPGGIAAVAVVIVIVAALSFALMASFAMLIVGLRPVEFLRAQKSGAACAALAAVVIVPVTVFSHAWGLSSFIALVVAGLGSGGIVLTAIMLAPSFFIGPTGCLPLYKQTFGRFRP